MKKKESKAKETMCAMAARKALAEMKKAAKNAGSICACCGRSAADKKVLCAPEAL